jgi:hypothetical protein
MNKFDIQFEDGWYSLYDSTGSYIDGFKSHYDAVLYAKHILGDN